MTAESIEVHDGIRLRCAPGIAAPLALEILAAPPLREIHRNRRCRVFEVRGDDRGWARKHYTVSRAARWLTPWRSRAGRSWRTARRGHERGLPFPAPICLAERVGGGETVLVSEWFPGDHLHLVHARERRGRLRDPEERQRFLKAIASGVVALLEGGVLTTDLAPQNLLVGEIDGRWQTCLVDLDDVRIVDRVPPVKIIENLAQLGHLPDTVSRIDRARFLRLFLEEGGDAPLEPYLLSHGAGALERDLGERIELLARRKTERLRARGATGHPYAGWGLDEGGMPIR